MEGRFAFGRRILVHDALRAVGGWSNKFTKKEFVKRFRCDGKEMRRVVFLVKRLNGSGPCGIRWNATTNNALVRMLHEHSDLHVTDEHALHSDVISYMRVEHCAPFFQTVPEDFKWGGDDKDSVRFEAFFEPHLSEELEVGLEFRSQALDWIP